jgi:hypothetical protein
MKKNGQLEFSGLADTVISNVSVDENDVKDGLRANAQEQDKKAEANKAYINEKLKHANEMKEYAK